MACCDDCKKTGGSCSPVLKTLNDEQLAKLLDYTISSCAKRGISTEEVTMTEKTETSTATTGAEHTHAITGAEAAATTTTTTEAVTEHTHNNVVVMSGIPVADHEKVVVAAKELTEKLTAVSGEKDALVAVKTELEAKFTALSGEKDALLANKTELTKQVEALSGEKTALSGKLDASEKTLQEMKMEFVKLIPQEQLNAEVLKAASKFVPGFDASKNLADHDAKTVMAVAAFSMTVGALSNSGSAGASETDAAATTAKKEKKVAFKGLTLPEEFMKKIGKANQ